jgi:predicted small metal-binding protein
MKLLFLINFYAMFNQIPFVKWLTAVKSKLWRSKMTKEIRCRDVGVDCDWVATGETEEEIMKKAAEHAKKAHGMNEIPPELVQRVREAIKAQK